MNEKFEIYGSKIRAFWMTDETWEGLKQEEDRLRNHAPDCYGAWYTCQSCGCDKTGRWGKPVHCPSHK